MMFHFLRIRNTTFQSYTWVQIWRINNTLQKFVMVISNIHNSIYCKYLKPHNATHHLLRMPTVGISLNISFLYEVRQPLKPIISKIHIIFVSPSMVWSHEVLLMSKTKRGRFKGTRCTHDNSFWSFLMIISDYIMGMWTTLSIEIDLSLTHGILTIK